MEKHYVVVCSWSNEETPQSITEIIGVRHSYEDAVDLFNSRLTEEKQYAKENNYTVYEDSESIFEAGLEGYCATNFTLLYIEQV